MIFNKFWKKYPEGMTLPEQFVNLLGYTKELDETIESGLESKTDINGNHLGSWQGLNKPTMSEEGMRATVENISENELPSIKTTIKGKVNIYQYENYVVDNDWSIAINKAIQENEGKEIYIPNGNYLIKSTIIINKTVRLTGESKLGTIIRTDSDIDMLYMQIKCEINNITFKVNTTQHTSTVITYFAIKGGNKFGKVNDIYIIGLDSYTNQTKAFRFKDLNGDSVSKSFFFFYLFENINVEFCDTFLLIDENFANCWTTSVTWKNVIVERCKTGVYFPNEFPWGYYSRYDFIDCQFQYNEKVTRVFNAPSDRSVIDWHVWDRSFFNTTAPLKSIMVKTGGRHNKVIIRNVDETQVECEAPKDYFVNHFSFFDSPISKNVLGDVTININGETGDDSEGNGSTLKPYKTINNVLSLLPKLINSTVTLNLSAFTFSDNIKLSNYYGSGKIKFVGVDKSTTKVPSFIIDNCNLNVELNNLSVAPAYGGDGVKVSNSNMVIVDNCNVISRSTNSINGIIILGGQCKVTNCYFEKINNCINSQQGAIVYVNGVAGTSNAYACSVENGGLITLVGTIEPSVATIIKNTVSGLIVSN